MKLADSCLFHAHFTANWGCTLLRLADSVLHWLRSDILLTLVWCLAVDRCAVGRSPHGCHDVRR